jgi:hypothetical protein
MKIFLTLLLAATAAAAEPPTYEQFMPADYKPSACAPAAESVCDRADRGQFTKQAHAHRAYDIDEQWIDAHWDEMRARFLPICAKIAQCYTLQGNNWVFCTDIAGEEFRSQCDRFPEGSWDRDQCNMFSTMWFVSLGAQEQLLRPAQDCAASDPAAKVSKLEVLVYPEQMPPDYDGEFFVHVLDAERRIPVAARVTADSGRIQAREGNPPKTGYRMSYKARLVRVPNPETGHSDVVSPTFTVRAPAYEPYTFAPVVVPRMKVEMSPAPDMLRRGPNVITVTATDADTGKPVNARVMGGEHVLGKTNEPFVLEMARGQRHPEIWVTSLYDHYSDVVVAPAGK